MSNTAKGPRKDREKPDTDILKEWADWMAAQTHSEADAELIRAVRNVCSQVGTWRAKYEQVNGLRFKEECSHIATRDRLATAQARVNELEEVAKHAQAVNLHIRARVALKSPHYEETSALKAALEKALSQPPTAEKETSEW